MSRDHHQDDELTLLTVAETAELLRCSEPVVRGLLAEFDQSDGSSGLRSVRLGPRLRRVLRADLEEWLRGSRPSKKAI